MRRWPLLVVAAWIIVALLLAPLAASIDEIVKTSLEEFLPPDAESVRAEREAARLLADEAQAPTPKYIVVVHGVEAGIERYLEDKEWYQELAGKHEARLFSWIDVLSNVENQMYSTAVETVNATASLVQGLAATVEAYQGLDNASRNLALLVEAADQAYAGLWAAAEAASQAAPGALQAANVTVTACTMLLPAEAGLYYDVVRGHVGLFLAGAYESGLNNETIAAALNYTAASPKGPVDTQLLGLVYQRVLEAGGPRAFNNTLAAEIAGGALAAQAPAPDWLTRVVVEAWSSVAAGDVDHAGLLLEQPPAEGQAALLERIQGLAEQARPLVAQAVGEALAAQLGGDAGALARLAAAKALEYGCDPERVYEAAAAAVAELLAQQGIPGEAAEAIARAAVGGSLDQAMVARLAAEQVLSQAGEAAAGLDADVLAQLLLRLDPEASGSLQGPAALAAGAYLAAVASGVDPGRAESILASSDPVLEAARLVLEARAGPEAAGLLDLLASRGLLDRDPWEAAVEAAAVLAAEKGNLTVEEARRVAEAAAAVARGEASVEEVARSLAKEWFEAAADQVLFELEGRLVEEGRGGFLVFVDPEGESLEERLAVAEAVKEDFKGRYPDAEILLGGDEKAVVDARRAALRDVERSDRISMVLVVVILAALLGSIVAVLLPFTAIGMGLVTSLAATYILAKAGVMDVTTHSRTIMFTTGLGLGIDYAAYVTRRFREAVARGLPPIEASAWAAKISLRPVAAGAAAAMIGFGSMLLAWDFPFIRSVGSNVPLTIAAVAAASLTLVPALLALLGGKRWFWWPRNSAAGEGPSIKPPRPWLAAIIVAVLVITAIAGLYGFEGSYDITANLPANSEARAALEALTSYYNPGILYPVIVVASSPDKAVEITNSISSLDCVASVEKADNGDAARVLRVILSVYPLSPEGIDCTAKIREEVHKVDPNSLVGGMPAINLDMKEYVSSTFYGRVYPAAIALMTLVLLAAYGGAPVALAAIAGVALAAYAASAITVHVYQGLLGVEVPWYLPVIVFTAILGVGMDYNSFYLASAREACLRECSRRSALESVEHAAPIVLGLAAIMVGAYAGLALAETPALSIMGTALALGVALAALLAALLLTPQVVIVLGRRAWWPRQPKD